MFGIETKNSDVKFFYATSNVGGFKFQTWTKKRGVKFYTFICIGAGGAGGNGFTGIAGAARGGGGGGGSGAISRLRIHASLIPDTLYLYPGLGGVQGGTATGELSYIALTNRTSAITQNINLLLRSGAAIAGAGGNGTGAAGGTAGSASTADTASGAIFQSLGIWFPNIGDAGSTGGAHTGVAGTVKTTMVLPISGGTGGGGVTAADFGGGSISITSGFLFPAVIGAAAGSNRGSDGYTMMSPFRALGGTGGGSSNAGVGGAGGSGGLGCGGGGGGGGTTGGTGGRGGNGCIIVIEEY